MLKKFLLVAFSFLFMSSFAFQVAAAGSDKVLWGDQATNIQKASALGNEDPRLIAAQLINVILGFLGIIAVGLIVYAGFLWMTAAGNEDKVNTAKKLLISAVIGLIIILAAFSIASYVLDAVYRVNT